MIEPKKGQRGGARPGAGRPPSGEPQREQFMIRLSPDERAQVEEEAEIEEQAPGTFAREELMRGVQRRQKRKGRK